MNWEDERYVRLYTRDTVDWLSLSFEAQGLLACILRKMSRSGLIELGKHGKRGVAIAIGHPSRWETIAPALEELLADGVIVIRRNCLVGRNFTQAQEANQSDAARQRARREKIRDQALAEELLGDELEPDPPEPPAVTKRDGASRGDATTHQPVTNRDELSRGEPRASRAVTPSQPIQPAVPSQPADPELLHHEEKKSVASRNRESGPTVPALQAVWNANKAPEMPEWRETPKEREKAARARLKERPDLNEWASIVARLAQSSFARGIARGSNGSFWIADPEFLLRPDSAVKIMEGKYDDRGPKGLSKPEPLPVPTQPDNPAGRTWTALLDTLELTGKTYAVSWLRRVRALEVTDQVLHLEAPDHLFINWVSDHYLGMLTEQLAPLQPRFHSADELAVAAPWASSGGR